MKELQYVDNYSAKIVNLMNLLEQNVIHVTVPFLFSHNV